jgi:flagellar basal body-associated protein FliL
MANEPKKQTEKPAAAAPAAEGAEAQKKNAKAGGGKMVFWAVLAGMVVINAVVAVVLVKVTMPKPEKTEEQVLAADSTAGAAAEVVEEPAYSDPPIEAVVNIKGSEDMHFLKAVFVFSFDVKKFKDLGAVLEARTPEFKSIIIDRLSILTMEDLQRQNIRDELRSEIKRLVNKHLQGATSAEAKETYRIAEVYINEFIIQ